MSFVFEKVKYHVPSAQLKFASVQAEKLIILVVTLLGPSEQVSLYKLHL